ncbi:MAG: MgtC/SapB family protein [Gammaproteobacteria bacterium]
MTDIESISIRLAVAVLAGSLIGFERAYHGRPAGLRTHTLVCLSSALLMLLTVFQWDLLQGMPLETIRTDPTRMAQGIMTGIGFLGAGVIMKENLTIRGLTTAASIWMTAAIGIIIGMGFFIPAAMATVMTIVVLSFFGWGERLMRSRRYARLLVRFKRSIGLPKDDLYEIIKAHKISATPPSYHLESAGTIFQYEMTISTSDPAKFHELAESLTKVEQIIEFSLMPTGD